MYPFFTNEFAGIPAETLNWIALAGCVLVGLLVLLMIFRMFRGPRFGGGRRGRNARLAVTDAASIGDDKRKLVLVRRDNVEHLLLIGGSNDLVVESNIVRTVATQPAAQPVKRSEPPVARKEPAPLVTQPPAPAVAAPAAQPVATPAVPQPAASAASSSPAPVATPAPATSPAPTVAASITAAAALVAAPIVPAVTGDKEGSPAADTKTESAPQAKEAASETALNPAEEMDALLDEISAEK